MTNFERIKQMSVEELTEFLEDTQGLPECGGCPALVVCLANGYDWQCNEAIKYWLEQEAK